MIPGGENSIFGDLMRKYDEALLSIPRHMTGRALLPDHALGLTGLSPASGGLGYRFWRSNADCAFLASYMHTSYHFPFFPPILELVPAGGMPPPRAPSVTAASQHAPLRGSRQLLPWCTTGSWGRLRS